MKNGQLQRGDLKRLAESVGVLPNTLTARMRRGLTLAEAMFPKYDIQTARLDAARFCWLAEHNELNGWTAPEIDKEIAIDIEQKKAALRYG